MAASDIPPHAGISKAEFDELLGHYPALIESRSRSKSFEDGEKTLQELDQYRFVDAPKTFGQAIPSSPSMTQSDVETLVRWKLRHGKFRPTLMSLISSNPPDLTSRTISSAIHLYRSSFSNPPSRSASIPPSTKSTTAALTALSKLRGVGPATASLLLAVHDPHRVMFFSDEAYAWLCGGKGLAAPARYNMAEYEALCAQAGVLAARLGVTPSEIERVAYVLLKRGGEKEEKGEETEKGKGKGKETEKGEEKGMEKGEEKGMEMGKKREDQGQHQGEEDGTRIESATKRKRIGERNGNVGKKSAKMTDIAATKREKQDEQDPRVRRSKRLKQK